MCGSVRHCYVGFVEHGEHSEDERDHFLHFIEPFSKTKETGWLWSTQFRQENLGMFIDFFYTPSNLSWIIWKCPTLN